MLILYNVTNPDEIQQAISSLNLTDSGLNQTVVDNLLGSSPNFNLLFSNFSQSFQEPTGALTSFLDLQQYQKYIDILYGSKLDVWIIK